MKIEFWLVLKYCMITFSFVNISHTCSNWYMNGEDFTSRYYDKETQKLDFILTIMLTWVFLLSFYVNNWTFIPSDDVDDASSSLRGSTSSSILKYFHFALGKGLAGSSWYLLALWFPNSTHFQLLKNLTTLGSAFAWINSFF